MAGSWPCALLLSSSASTLHRNSPVTERTACAGWSVSSSVLTVAKCLLRSNTPSWRSTTTAGPASVPGRQARPTSVPARPSCGSARCRPSVRTGMAVVVAVIRISLGLDQWWCGVRLAMRRHCWGMGWAAPAARARRAGGRRSLHRTPTRRSGGPCGRRGSRHRCAASAAHRPVRKAGPAHAASSAVARPNDLIFMMSPEWNMRGAMTLPRVAGSLRSRA
ncbi:hypothetical protein D9M68_672860 [compost metagenome]